MTMKIFSSPHLLAALGALGVATAASAQADTSQWKCASCPYPKGTSGSVDAGVGYVTDSSEKFGDYTGLDKKGAFLELGGTATPTTSEEFGSFVRAEIAQWREIARIANVRLEG